MTIGGNVPTKSATLALAPPAEALDLKMPKLHAKNFLPADFATQSTRGGKAKRRTAFHVAMIMDGNGRWATRRGLPRIAGHRAGVETVRRMVEAAPDLGITKLTLFAFSSDNWRRPPDEVGALMALLQHYLDAEIDRLDRQRHSPVRHRPPRPAAGATRARDRQRPKPPPRQDDSCGFASPSITPRATPFCGAARALGAAASIASPSADSSRSRRPTTTARRRSTC